MSLLLLAGCSSDSGTSEAKTKPIPLEEAEKVIVEQQNTMGVKFLNTIASKHNRTDNLILSPISINYALGMLANGASGETLEEILSVIDMPVNDLQQLNELNSRLLAELPHANSKVKLYIANSIWFEPNFSIKESFVSDNSKYYNAEIRKIPLDTEQSKNEINRWVSDNTGKMIPELLKSPLNVDWSLINAVYFNAVWNKELKKDDKHIIFRGIDGIASNAEFMKADNNVYAYAGNFIAFRVNYAGDNFCIEFIVPKDGGNPELTPEVLKEVNAEFAASPRIADELSFPKFSVEAEENMTEALEDLGMKKAFSGDADFSRMCQQKTLVSEVIHTAKIEVDEYGTKAAAVTHIDGPTSPGPSVDKYVIDHPFYFLIKEKSSNSTLFIGRVNKL